MAVDPVPYFIATAGVKHSGEVVRQALHDSTGGAEGVSSPSALRVTASATPDTNVQVLTGGALLRNRYPAGSGQSYSARNATQTAVPITATGSAGGRTDLIVLRILDPQYEGQPPADPNAFQYTRLAVIENVAATVFTAAELNLGYPAIALARVTLPASTATVQPSHITNLRRLARPKREIKNRLLFPSVAKVMSKTAYESWPFSGVMSNVEVPDWATTIDIVATINGIEWTGAAGLIGTGGVRTKFDTNVAQNGIVRGVAGQRQSISIIGNHPVTVAQRGKLLTIALEGYQTVGTAGIEADTQSSIAVMWEFSEVPD